MKTKTDELLKLLEKVKNPIELKNFIKAQKDESLTLHQFLEIVIAEKNIAKKDIIKKSGLYRTYAYQIINGIKQPSRDKLIALCFGCSMDLTETQQALAISGQGTLYAKKKRDAVIIYSINNSFDLQETNQLLYDLEMKTLE